MENTLLYFYSTIPQVLAASIALVFVFIIFKLQEFDKKINIQCLNFASTLGNNVSNSTNWQRLQTSGKFMTNYKAGYFNGISNIMLIVCSEREHDNESAVKHLRKIANRARNIEKEKYSIINNAKYFCAFGFFVIISSIVTLYFVKFIVVISWLSNSLFVIFIIFTFISLFWIYRILTITLNK